MRDITLTCLWSNLLGVAIIFGFVALDSVWGQFLQGETAHCTSEGTLVSVPHITNNPCINCSCQRYQIVCEKRTCPFFAESCYFHQSNTSDEDRCCHECKGCDFQGSYYRNGQQWTSNSDPCQSFYCGDGIITKTAKTVCYTPCTHPVPVIGTCCPVCKGCFANGKVYKEGDRVSISDPCVRCICKDGNLICDKIACPVLACPINLYMMEPGTCCPTCHGFRQIVQSENHCMVGKRVLRNDQQITIDHCTFCTCMRSTLFCKRQVCPVLTCPVEFQERSSSGCCPTCMSAAPVYCETEEATYSNGETWQLDVCVSCVCEDGHVKCSVKECPTSISCKEGEVIYKEKTDCCEKCVPKNAVCTVYGDPHYRTFDGKSFSFQGRCKYTAVEDCFSKDKRFEIELRNDARKSSHFTWTKSVAIYMEQVKIVLLQKLRVRVNRKEVRLPYVRLGSLSIISNGFSLVVRTIYGLKVTWDGDSYLEISLPHSYRNQVCGLCGNFNGNESDDFTIRNTAAITEDVVEFAQSWQVGRKPDSSKCSVSDESMAQVPRARNARNVPCQGHSVKKGLKVLRSCRIFKSTAVKACRKLVDPEPYYKACLSDMCDCPRNRACLCQSFTAFLRECGRHGGSVTNIREMHCKTL